jgi:transaldolase/glucose-6-phosphate isomerase
MIDAATRRASLFQRFRFSPGTMAEAVRERAAAAASAASGLWRRDPAVWSRDPIVQQKIANRLGWLASPALMLKSLDRIRAFAESVKRDGFTDIVLLGMGGSSLAPEVLREVVGVSRSWPRFHMLDSTDPAAVRAVSAPLKTTVFILASKSGTTIEPNSLAAHYRAALVSAGIAKWADHFVAITDDQTALAERARAEAFRETFINPTDIGGRYSAISLFGLVPAALMGQDVGALVESALAMMSTSEEVSDAAQHPAIGLGLAMAAGAQRGRNKLTLLAPSELEPLGLWIEQLVAESTGKRGEGVVPIVGEDSEVASSYGHDRVFVDVTLETAPKQNGVDAGVLKQAGKPVVEISMTAPTDLGAEFVRWEIATAVAGALLGINPFDEPNVQQAKDATRVLLDQYKAAGRLPVGAADQTADNGLELTLTTSARERLAANPARLLTLVQAGDYLGILAYLGPDPALGNALKRLRTSIGTATGAATMFGYGPRYLHSTGQLHKGGPNTGVFILITAPPQQDIPIPGEAFSFGTLEFAQALGDFASLDATGRRAVHVRLPSPDPQWIDRLCELLVDEGATIESK